MPQAITPFTLVCGIDVDELYIGQIRAYLSPLDKTYPLPANGVAIEAPHGELPEHHVWQLNATRDGWSIISDYRDATVYDTTTEQPMPTLGLGELLPATGTLNEPPELGEKEARRWDAAAGAWEVVPDRRGEGYWLEDGTYHIINVIGEVPPIGALTEPPPPTTEQLATAARGQRDGLLSGSEWLIQRHRDEQEVGRETTLSAMQYTELQAWRQALRDWPASDGWPHIATPVKPEWFE